MNQAPEISDIHMQRMKQVSFVTWVGIWANLVLAIAKMGAGYFGNSRAVFADGIHSLSDLLTNIAVLVGVRYWLAPPDVDHPYGHQRLESLVSLFIGVLLAFVGFRIGYDALLRILNPIPPSEHVGSLWALAAALFSVITKEILFRWTLYKAKTSKSSALEASAWECRSDAISSLPTVLAVAVALWLPQFAAIDAVAAILVACIIGRSAWKICREALDVLLDKGADPELIKKISSFSNTIEGIHDVHDIRTRYLGVALTVDLHAYVDSSLSLAQAHQLAHNLEDALCSPEGEAYLGVEICDALVHIDPLPEPE